MFPFSAVSHEKSKFKGFLMMLFINATKEPLKLGDKAGQSHYSMDFNVVLRPYQAKQGLVDVWVFDWLLMLLVGLQSVCAEMEK